MYNFIYDRMEVRGDIMFDKIVYISDDGCNIRLKEELEKII